MRRGTLRIFRSTICRGGNSVGAAERIRTSTVLLPPAPQAGASASSATTAKDLQASIRGCHRSQLIGHRWFCCLTLIPAGSKFLGRVGQVRFVRDVVSRKHGVSLVSGDSPCYVMRDTCSNQISGRTAPEIMDGAGRLLSSRPSTIPGSLLLSAHPRSLQRRNPVRCSYS